MSQEFIAIAYRFQFIVRLYSATVTKERFGNKMSDLLDDEADRASIKTWLDSWCSCVVSVDFASARLLLDENIVSFGTWMDVVEGLD